MDNWGCGKKERMMKNGTWTIAKKNAFCTRVLCIYRTLLAPQKRIRTAILSTEHSLFYYDLGPSTQLTLSAYSKSGHTTRHDSTLIVNAEKNISTFLFATPSAAIIGFAVGFLVGVRNHLCAVFIYFGFGFWVGCRVPRICPVLNVGLGQAIPNWAKFGRTARRSFEECSLGYSEVIVHDSGTREPPTHRTPNPQEPRT